MGNSLNFLLFMIIPQTKMVRVPTRQQAHVFVDYFNGAIISGKKPTARCLWRSQRGSASCAVRVKRLSKSQQQFLVMTLARSSSLTSKMYLRVSPHGVGVFLLV